MYLVFARLWLGKGRLQVLGDREGEAAGARG
jgi:hypothetical protein